MKQLRVMRTLEGKLEYLALQLNQAELPCCGGEIQHLVEADLMSDIRQLFKKKQDKNKEEFVKDVFDEEHLENERVHPKTFDPTRPWDDDLIDQDPVWEKLEQGLREFEQAS